MTKNNTAIQIDAMSKVYRLGEIGTGTLSHDLNRWWHKVRGKEDPYSIISVNDKSQKAVEGESVYALKDINLQVEEGEVLGIIGKNGAGKSTLLKILSRVTSPSSGRLKIRGRVASLLEVGTGFHPEMTGRENIYMNGTILGMRKWEIDQKLDEIVEFAGISKFLDTPVKRFSSGMTVRLGFSIAAFLEPEILIVDEVLAVGDAAFQKKAIGKMKDVSRGSGRTVLFVSHNMSSVASLCTKAIVLENGTISFSGGVDEAVSTYLKGNFESRNSNTMIWKEGSEPEKNGLKLSSLKLYSQTEEEVIRMDHGIVMECVLNADDVARKTTVNFQFKDESGKIIFVCTSKNAKEEDAQVKGMGRIVFKGHIPPNFFNEGEFSVNVNVFENKQKVFEENDVLTLNVNPEPRELGTWMGRAKGVLRPEFTWEKEITLL